MPAKPNRPLDKKVAVVTGATGEIGRSIALALAEQGADVVLVGRRVSLLRAVAKDCLASGSKARWCRVDLLNDAQIRNLGRRVGLDCGGVDILIHGAAV